MNIVLKKLYVWEIQLLSNYQRSALPVMPKQLLDVIEILTEFSLWWLRAAIFYKEVTVSIIKYVYCLWVDDDVAWFSVDGGLSGGAIAGIVIGVIVILVLIAVAVVCFCKSRQSKADSFEGWYSYSTILTCQCRFTQC